MTIETLGIAGSGLSAEINPHGAELWRLRDSEGRDLLWDGDPAFWTGRAPILFPVIGCVAGGVVRVDGQTYPMPKHGFARGRTWAVVDRQPASVTLRLEADDETRASYPFDFRLDLRFAIEGETLDVVATLTNPADIELPASLGFHPALRWPLPWGAPRDAHLVRFARDEPAPIRRIDRDGLVRPAPEPTPVVGTDLHPEDRLFEDDALIFDRLASRSLLYGAPDASALGVSFPAMPELGIWTKPGAGYLCIEPWAGIADPQGYAGELRDKPGIVRVPPRSDHIFAMRIALVGRALG